MRGRAGTAPPLRRAETGRAGLWAGVVSRAGRTPTCSFNSPCRYGSWASGKRFRTLMGSGARQLKANWHVARPDQVVTGTVGHIRHQVSAGRIAGAGRRAGAGRARPPWAARGTLRFTAGGQRAGHMPASGSSSGGVRKVQAGAGSALVQPWGSALVQLQNSLRFRLTFSRQFSVMHTT